MKATPWTRHPGDDLPGVGSSSRATDHGAVQGIEESARPRLCLRTRARAHDSVRRRCAIAHAGAGARLRSLRRAGSRMISARDAEGREGVAVGRESAARSSRAHQRSCSTLARRRAPHLLTRLVLALSVASAIGPLGCFATATAVPFDDCAYVHTDCLLYTSDAADE